jgi:hypothetical protein
MSTIKRSINDKEIENMSVSIVERIKNENVLEDDYDIFADIDNGGILTPSQLENVEKNFKPYLPPKFFEQNHMKKRVKHCIKILSLSSDELDSCQPMLYGCIISSLNQDKKKFFTIENKIKQEEKRMECVKEIAFDSLTQILSAITKNTLSKYNIDVDED